MNRLAEAQYSDLGEFRVKVDFNGFLDFRHCENTHALLQLCRLKYLMLKLVGPRWVEDWLHRAWKYGRRWRGTWWWGVGW